MRAAILAAMATIGSRIDERGMLATDHGRLIVCRESGGRWQVEGCPVSDLVLGQPGRIVGTIIEANTIAIESFTCDL